MTQNRFQTMSRRAGACARHAWRSRSASRWYQRRVRRYSTADASAAAPASAAHDRNAALRQNERWVASSQSSQPRREGQAGACSTHAQEQLPGRVRTLRHCVLRAASYFACCLYAANRHVPGTAYHASPNPRVLAPVDTQRVVQYAPPWCKRRSIDQTPVCVELVLHSHTPAAWCQRHLQRRPLVPAAT